MDRRNKIFTVVGTLAILATAGFVGTNLFMQQDSQPSSTNTSTSISTDASSIPSTSTSQSTQNSSTITYKDGTYTAMQNYSVHHNSNAIKVTLTIADGKITSISTDNTYNDQESGSYIAGFEGSVDADATGQSLGSYSPSRIGGASATTSAFANAVSGIRTQAAGS